MGLMETSQGLHKDMKGLRIHVNLLLVTIIVSSLNLSALNSWFPVGKKYTTTTYDAVVPCSISSLVILRPPIFVYKKSILNWNAKFGGRLDNIKNVLMFQIF